jgi:hypothetical protein
MMNDVPFGKVGRKATMDSMTLLIPLLLIPTGLNLHNDAEFQFCIFFLSPNPSGIYRDFIALYLATCLVYYTKGGYYENCC